jgi:hypothetical protein
MLSKNKPLQEIFKYKVLIFKLNKKNYQTPVNRWANHYSNGDNCFNQEWTYIETMNMSQPFDPKDATKAPDYYHKQHANDFRYNKELANEPRRHLTTGLKLKVYNNHSLDALMHGNEWNDMQPDFQLEEPMGSNHYLQSGGHLRALWFFLYFMIFIVGKFIDYNNCFFFNFFNFKK